MKTNNILYSFDVFDTLIGRKCIEPRKVFCYIENMIQNAYDEEYFGTDIYTGFAEIRIIAERLFSIKHSDNVSLKNSFTLDDIYEQIAEIQNVEDDKIRELLQLELDAEYELSSPIVDNIRLVEQLINDGYKVVLISDMYLQKDRIRKLLLKHSDIFEEIPIYVSCEYGARKSNGLLFQAVSEAEGKAYKHWVHYGDNRIGDYLIPRVLGIEAHLVEKKTGVIDDGLSKEKKDENIVIANDREEFDSPEEELGYKYGGRVLFPYVMWCVSVAKHNRIQDIYFIARDGYVLKKIADIVIDNTKDNIITHYLYGSRKSWTIVRSNRDNVNNYLQQEIDFTKLNLFVDVQGAGNSLENALEAVDINGFKKQLCVFYDKVSAIVRERCRMMSYSDNVDTTYIELLTRAPHAATLSYVYRDKSNRMIPVFQEDDGKYNARIEKYVEGVLSFVKDNLHLLKCEMSWYDLITVSNNALRQLNQSTDGELMDYLYDMPYVGAEDGTEGAFAPKLSLKEIDRYIDESIVDATTWYKGYNINYSIMRCGDSILREIASKRKAYPTDILNQEVEDDDVVLIIYGAGGGCRKLLHRIMNTDCVKVIQCVDMDEEKYGDDDIRVDKITDIKSEECDYVLISIEDEEAQKGARYILEVNGVPSIKIVTEKELRDILIARFMIQ